MVGVKEQINLDKQFNNEKNKAKKEFKKQLLLMKEEHNKNINKLFKFGSHIEKTTKVAN